jgi:hypothetical protein
MNSLIISSQTSPHIYSHTSWPRYP